MHVLTCAICSLEEGVPLLLLFPCTRKFDIQHVLLPYAIVAVALRETDNESYLEEQGTIILSQRHQAVMLQRDASFKRKG